MSNYEINEYLNNIKEEEQERKEEEQQNEQQEQQEEEDNYYNNILISNNDHNKEGNEIFYEVCFKCYTSIYGSFEIREIGDMVIVHCNRGYNIGFILREVKNDELIMNDGSIYKPKKILSHIKDGDETIKNILRSKISAEIFALSKSKLFMKGHKLAELTLPITTEFQFDRKKLTVYLKKYEEISVCRLVRRLYDTFKMRIKVIEVESFEVLQEKVQLYLDISKLNLTLNDVFNSEGSLCAGPFLNLLHSQSEKRSSPKNSNNNNINNNNFNNNNNNSNNSRLSHSHYSFNNTLMNSNQSSGNFGGNERGRDRVEPGIIGSRNSINSLSTTSSSSTSSSTIPTNYWESSSSSNYNDQRYNTNLTLPPKSFSSSSSSYTRSYPKYPIGNDLAMDMAKYRSNRATPLSTNTSEQLLYPPPPPISSSSTTSTTTLSLSSNNYSDASPTSTSSIENRFFFDEFHDYSHDHHIQPSYHHQQISNLQYLTQHQNYQQHQPQHHNSSLSSNPSSTSTSASSLHHSKVISNVSPSTMTNSSNYYGNTNTVSFLNGLNYNYPQQQQQQHQQNQSQYHFQSKQQHSQHLQHHQMLPQYGKSYNTAIPVKSYHNQFQSGYDSSNQVTQAQYSGY